MKSKEDETDGVSSVVEMKELAFAVQSMSAADIAGIMAVVVLTAGAENGPAK